ncbi:branched-chain amino acid ABC transporter substrate-binding protein [Blastococcus sp. TF02-8]|uniref:branched-chain amino acid ABC transporter substrate-binding protein n=1 Tax=Blastococcus sp. TF02-8 TaxID=2250574 RepID=UPI000DEA4907|nr:branched-chain amino acid ABC transporter substrate-binding protein [Blastococcus sp. TF02-8]RBY93721.1 branched-chain amino acid ABC transporter substrate-binding protein [Blastococcus sp. TF02-8]
MRSTRPATWLVPLALVSALTLSACSNDSSDDKGGGGLGGSGGGETYKIAFQGPLSGDNAQLGINEVNGVQLAIDQANESGDLDFTLELVKADDQGSPEQAPTAAAQVLQDEAVLGVIGPSFSGATKAIGATYGDAGLSFISPSATNPTLSEQGFPTFHRIVPSDNVEGSQAADLFAAKGYKKVVVIDDLSDYGKGVADELQKGLEAKGVAVQRIGVDAKTTDYGSTATQVASAGADALFYGGYDAQAGLLAQALKAANFTGDKYTGNGGKSSVFTDGAGDAGDGWFFTCGCSDATVAPEAKEFSKAYQEAFNSPPSTYSPEAFDAANAMIEAIKTAAEDGAPTRDSVEKAVDGLDYKGITTSVKFDDNGEVDASAQTVNLFVQENGQIKLLGNIKDQA